MLTRGNQPHGRNQQTVRWTIGKQLAAGLLGIILLLIGSIGFGLWGLSQQATQYKMVADDLRMAQVMSATLVAAIDG